MPIHGLFIGINRHQDPTAPELTGAVNDATALWALFRDSVPALNATLLVDERATHAALQSAIGTILKEAGPDDTVVISYSGHGSRDHRLVPHDYSSASHDETSIPMAILADYFKSSSAKVIILILDCCFSGGAPARVLENSPLSRASVYPFDAFVGTGRMIIAAANVNEPAYELPGSGHGILTKALIDVLRSDEESIDLPSAFSDVSARVLAEAARIGVTQTPILINYIEGSLALRSLKPGQLYYQHFPHADGVKVGADIRELSAFGLSPQVLDAWVTRFPTLNKLQLEAINDYRVLDGESLLVVAPTTSGKTFLGELAAVRAIEQGRKAVFLFPYKALVNEKHEEFLGLYGQILDLRVLRITGDHTDDSKLFLAGKYDIAILTYEMFLGLVVGNPWTLHQLGLVVVDEAQFINDGRRGIIVELLLTYLITARERGIFPQLLALSAVIGGTNNFDKWLGCRSLVQMQRPVPLVEGVLDRQGTYQHLDEDGRQKTTQLLPLGSIHQRKDKPEKQDIIVPLVRHLFSERKDEKVIVFRNKRGSTNGCAAYLGRELCLPPDEVAIRELPQHDPSTVSTQLRDCLGMGTGFHNTNLKREEKLVVERSFRRRDGGIQVLVATTTVAAGVNTPASTVIIVEHQFVGDDAEAYTVGQYKNMAGRAGRLGFNERGRSILLADTPFEREGLFRDYVVGQLEPIASSFAEEDVATWFLRLLSQIRELPEDEVVRLLSSTYGGFLRNLQHPGWKDDATKSLAGLCEEMVGLGLLEREAGFVQLTLLGRACGRSALTLRSAMRLVEQLRLMGSATTLTGLLVAVQGLPELDAIYTPCMKREPKWTGEAVNMFGHAAVNALQRHATDEREYHRRCKRALAVSGWIEGVPTEEIERRFSANAFSAFGYGDMIAVADAARFHLRPACSISSALFPEILIDESDVEELVRRLEMGLPTAALSLLDLPVALSRGECLALMQLGITNESSFWGTDPSVLERILGTARMVAVEQARPKGASR